MKLSQPLRRALEAVHDRKACRTYRGNGNVVRSQKGVGAASLLKLEKMRLIQESTESAGTLEIIVQLELTAAGRAELGAVAGTQFYIYKRGRSGWMLAAEATSYADAETAARKLCPRGRDIYTEPGHDLPRGFFGSHGGRGWSAMITTARLAGD